MCLVSACLVLFGGSVTLKTPFRPRGGQPTSATPTERLDARRLYPTLIVVQRVVCYGPGKQKRT